jgi:thiol:disulfide interchange protein DsbA
MKKILFLFLTTFLFLAACDSSDKTANETDQAVVEEAAPEAITEAAPEVVQTEEVEDAQPVLVEESAAEAPAASDAQELKLPEPKAAVSPANWKFTEGKNYTRLTPTQPTVGGADKIEVAEIFWYGCGHCYDFEPYINKWKETKPANVRFVRIPALWNKLVELHGRLYYTEEVLERNGVITDPAAFRNAVFREYHQQGNRLTSEAAIQKFFERYNVDSETFYKTWKSFEVDQKIRVARDLSTRYGISGVPAVVVNGKYRTSAQEAGGYPAFIELIDELIAKESIR